MRKALVLCFALALVAPSAARAQEQPPSSVSPCTVCCYIGLVCCCGASPQAQTFDGMLKAAWQWLRPEAYRGIEHEAPLPAAPAPAVKHIAY